MTKPIAGTKTEQKLLQSYFAESAAYTRYTFYALQAAKENYFPVERIFNETAANELRHAKVTQLQIWPRLPKKNFAKVSTSTMKPPGLPAAKASTTSPTTSRP